MKPREIADVAERFLSELGRGIPSEERVMVGYAEEATVQTDATGKKLNAGWWPASWTKDKVIKINGNAYACISSSIKTPNPKTGALRYWRGDASFGHGLALMVDDVGNGKGSKGELHVDQLRAVLEPTAIVETSPGNHQFWYFLDSPEPDRKRFKAFLLAFVTSVLADRGGDTTIRDISRYGRMPAGINNKRDKANQFKYADERGECFRVRLAEEPDYMRRYSIDQIAAAFGFQIVVPVERAIDDDERAALDLEKRFDAEWLRIAIKVLSEAKAGEGTGGEVSQNMSGKYRIACPWGDEHTNGDRYGAYFRGAIPGAEYEYVFGCGHDTCRKDNKRTWSPFVDKIVMPYIEDELSRANRECSWADAIMERVRVKQNG